VEEKRFDMKKIILVLVSVALLNNVFSQTTKQAPETGDYAVFARLNPQPNTARGWMDTIHFPPAEYGSSLLWVLVKPHYLSLQQVNALTRLTAPPANSSDRTRKELDYLLQLQQNRTPEQVKRVTALGGIGYWPQIAGLNSHPDHQQVLKDLYFEARSVLGDQCTAERYPLTTKLLENIMLDDRVMEFKVKYTYLRPRPYHLEKRLQPLDHISSPSYASGHSLWAYLQAYTWSELLPQKKDAFLKVAEEIRRSREIMGIHYPSDNSASRTIAFQMLQYYHANPQFEKDFKAALSEWK
jgi:acid phosphatase (class A)